MLTILLSWIFLSTILFITGDAVVLAYNKLCKQNEQYSSIDRIILGLSFLICPLSLWSLWLPSNHLFLFIIILFCLMYYLFYRNRINKIIYSAIVKLKSKPSSFYIFTSIFLFILLSAVSWEDGIFDSLFYHLQNIRWNEEYAIVPGLGNLDDHFAFNSNYLLASAIFTFRFLLGEAIYPLQSYFIMLLGIWILFELYSSKFEIKRAIILFAYMIFYILSIRFMLNTSTDILPNLLVFYTVSKYILYPDSLNKNFLYALILPAFVITCKLSMSAFLLLSVYLLIIYVKRKNYKPLFIAIIPICTIIFWLIRNIIISGYLIYPLPEINLFSFDWQIPEYVAILQKEFIHSIGYTYLKIALFQQSTGFRDPIWMNYFITGVYIITFAAILIFLFLLITKRKNTHQSIILLFVILLLSLCLWFASGPDLRFIPGIFCSFIVIGFTTLFTRYKTIYYVTSVFFCLFLITIGFWTSWRIYDRYKMIIRWETTREKRPFSSFLFKPYSYYHFYEALTTENIEDHYKRYELNNNIIIYISTVSNFTYDKLPATVKMNNASKLTNYECLEARGNSIQEGFRVKEKCR